VELAHERTENDPIAIAEKRIVLQAFGGAVVQFGAKKAMSAVWQVSLRLMAGISTTEAA
jgi:hypothetical protein